jgi:hypothetical protein
VELAPKWEIEAVLDALRDKKRLQLAEFIETRYQTRFFEPISILEKESVRGICWKKGDSDPREPIRPYGFAIMSLACQMIETLEAYQRGIPTTNRDDFTAAPVPDKEWIGHKHSSSRRSVVEDRGSPR